MHIVHVFVSLKSQTQEQRSGGGGGGGGSSDRPCGNTAHPFLLLQNTRHSSSHFNGTHERPDVPSSPGPQRNRCLLGVG